MPTPDYIAKLRTRIGTDLLLVPTVVIVLRNADGELLVVRNRETGAWHLPGGIVEPGELPSDAAVRETWEEAGVWAELLQVAAVIGGQGCGGTYPNGDQLAWVATVFSARPIHGQPQPDGAETDDARFVSQEQLEALALTEHARMFIAAESQVGQASQAGQARSGAYFAASTLRLPPGGPSSARSDEP